MIFNGSAVHEYEGHHSADGILEFIQVLPNSNQDNDNSDNGGEKDQTIKEAAAAAARILGETIAFLSLQDLVSPSVVVLDPSSFADKVKGEMQ